MTKKVGNRGETHAWFDGESWHVYTERKHDIRRFEGWWGKPTRRGREGACAHWVSLPIGSVAIRRPRRGGGVPFQNPASGVVSSGGGTDAGNIGVGG